MSAVFTDEELFLINSAPKYSPVPPIEPRSKRFLDRAQVNMATWYHVTHTARWHEQVLDAQVHVHLGTYETAMARMADVQDFYVDAYLFEVRLLDAYLDPSIYRDVPFDMEHPLPHSRYDGYRYLNEHENPGNISLFVQPDAFEVLRVEVL